MELYYEAPPLEKIKKTLLYLFFVGNMVGMTALWWTKSGFYIHHPENGGILIAIGRLVGLYGEYFILIQLVLIGRIRFIENLFGFDKLNKFHRWIGYSIFTLLLGHPLLLIIGNATSNSVSFLSQLGDYLANTNGVLNAFIALVLYLFVIVISIAVVRKKLRYETWYFTHLLVYLAIGLALSHQLNTGDIRGPGLWYWYILNYGVFALVLVYRLLRPLYLFSRHRFYIKEVVQETPDVCSVYITGQHMEDFKFEAGQYANITILASGMWYTHPFSFSAAYNGNYIRFSIKSLGDFTSKIPTLKPGTHVIIDGPLGRFVEDRAERDKYLLVAGGIGITPIRSMTESLASKQKDICIVYGSRTEQDIAFRTELDALAQTPGVKIHHVLSAPTPGYESGRIDKERIVRLVPDFFTREVFLCGPPPMMVGTVKNLKELGFADKHIHYENFSF